MKINMQVKAYSLPWRVSKSILSGVGYLYIDRIPYPARLVSDFIRNIYNDICWEIALILLRRVEKKYMKKDDPSWYVMRLLKDVHVHEMDKTIKIIYGCLKLLLR